MKFFNKEVKVTYECLFCKTEHSSLDKIPTKCFNCSKDSFLYVVHTIERYDRTIEQLSIALDNNSEYDE